MTPAVNDLLKDKSVSLVRTTDQANANSPSKHLASVLVATHNTTDDNTANRIRQSGRTVRTISITNCEQLGGELRSGEVAVIVSSRPFEAVCHANRDTRVCGVYANNTAECKSALSEVNANTLVVRPGNNDRGIVPTFLESARAV